MKWSPFAFMFFVFGIVLSTGVTVAEQPRLRTPAVDVQLDASVAELRVANIFTDNMVLQRGEPFLIWGWSDANRDVSVTLKDQTVSTTPNADGKWITKFAPISVGEPFEVTVQSGDETLTLKNVVAGEVWICSGQSNMEWIVQNSNNFAEEKKNANWPLIRVVKVNHATSTHKLADTANTGWQVCTPETVGNFTAVGYFFGRELHEQLDVPIGLINTSWGGTIIETWISGESLKGHPDFADRVRTIEAMNDDAAKDQTQTRIKKWDTDLTAALADESDQWQSDVDDSKWKQLKVPGNWERQGFPDLDGVAWYRKSFQVPESWAGKKSTVSLAQIDDVDQTYLNGTKIGGMNEWNAPRKYSVDAGVLKPGENTIAVRVADGNGVGGIHGDAKDVWVSTEGEDPIQLAGEWRFKPSSATASLGKRPAPGLNGPNHPTLLHNAMVNPIVPYTVRGAIWYQGESNGNRGFQYRSLMPLLISDWRSKWNSDMSFYWVQLANFRDAATVPADSDWAELREAQSMALQVPKTGQAVIIDIGEAKDIHPRNKQDVGKRLALNALAKDYGKQVEFSGPVFQSVSFRNNQAIVSFSHADGLTAKDGELQRFEVAGADKKFHWADAKIEGERVIVSSADVAQPVAVRYAWADNPEGCNLYNAAGLPASPFRTDQWKRE